MQSNSSRRKGFSSWSLPAQWLWPTGMWRSSQTKDCPLHWQEDSYPLDHQGNLGEEFLKAKFGAGATGYVTCFCLVGGEVMDSVPGMLCSAKSWKVYCYVYPWRKNQDPALLLQYYFLTAFPLLLSSLTSLIRTTIWICPFELLESQGAQSLFSYEQEAPQDSGRSQNTHNHSFWDNIIKALAPLLSSKIIGRQFWGIFVLFCHFLMSSQKCPATWCEELTHLKRPWCWGRFKAGEGDDRGWDGWMASLTQWTWVWVNSGSWWWTGKPGMLQFMGSQRVRHDWATELN